MPSSTRGKRTRLLKFKYTYEEKMSKYKYVKKNLKIYGNLTKKVNVKLEILAVKISHLTF